MAAVPGEKERLALVRARLAAEEREALEAIKEDLCQWLSKPGVLALDIAPASFLPVLDSGVPTSTLAGLVQEGARRCNTSGKMLSVTVPMTPLACKSIKAPRGTAMYQACARDNAAQFIEWCRSLGVEEAVIFESVGLVEHRDERRVILCLLDVARFAEKVGITPPQLVALEKEIDQLESESESCVDEATSNEHQLSQPEIEKEHFSDQQSDKGVPVVGDDTLSDRRTGSSEETEPREEEWVSEERCSDSDKKMSEGAEEEKTESEEEPPTKRLKRVSDNLTKETGSCTLSPNQPPPQQPPLHTHSHGKQLIHRRSKQWDKRKPVQSKQSPAGKKETVDEKVMRCVGECTCQHRLQVKNCGKGKFTVMPNPHRGVTVYARLLSDRMMVRVGGGWETLEHFLLKHDPCRLESLTALKTQAAKSSKNGTSLGKRGREL